MLQLGITYKELFTYPWGSLCYSVETSDPSENHSLSNRDLSEAEIETVERKSNDLNRIPSFYFEKTNNLNGLVSTLVSHKYKLDWEDAWLFYEHDNIALPENVRGEVVVDEAGLELFISTFARCFQENDPQNPHGSMDGRLENVRNVWHAQKGTGRLEYYTIYQGSTPVATSALTSYKKIGYIDSVGSLQEVRGQGFGKTATFFAVKESMKQGNTTHCLCTIANTFTHDFYKRIGFDHRFSAVGYIKD